MNFRSAITAEKYPTKVGAVYPSAQEANNAIRELQAEPALLSENIAVIRPEDPDIATILEPEGRRIWLTAIRAHTSMGLIGVALGLTAASTLVIAGVPAVMASPIYSVGIVMVLGGVLGLMVGGALTLRPDHDLYLQRARNATEKENCFVLVHVRSNHQKLAAKAYFEKHSKKPIFTL